MGDCVGGRIVNRWNIPLRYFGCASTALVRIAKSMEGLGARDVKGMRKACCESGMLFFVRRA